MNRKLIFVGLLLGLFIFPLFLNIHKVNADDKAPVMLSAGCTSGTALAECQNGTAEERIECYKKNDKAYGDRIECYTNNDKAYRERILELERNLLDNEPPGTDGDACQEQQQGITQLSDLLLQCREDHAAAKEEIGHSQRKIEDTQIVVTEHAQTISDLSNQLAESKTRAAPLEEQIRSLTSTLQEQAPQNVQLTAEVQRLKADLLATQQRLNNAEAELDRHEAGASAEHHSPEVRGPEAKHVHANGRAHDDWEPDRASFSKMYLGSGILCEYFLELISLGGLQVQYATHDIWIGPHDVRKHGMSDAERENYPYQRTNTPPRSDWFWEIGGEVFLADGLRLLPQAPADDRYSTPDKEPSHCQP
jgi:peptidoglycan hydrolase CwlO-like protein